MNSSFSTEKKAFCNNVKWQRMRSSRLGKFLFVCEHIHLAVERTLQVKDKFPCFNEGIFHCVKTT